MNLTPEQMMAAHKANVQALVGMTRQAFTGMEQLMELNLSLTKTVLADAHQLSLDSLTVKDSQELLALQTSLLAPMTQKIMAYQQELAHMAQSLGGDLGHQAQAQIAQGQAQFQQWLATSSPSDANGGESMFNAFKAAVDTGTRAMETIQQALQGASSVVQDHMQTQRTTTSSQPKTAKPSSNTVRKTASKTASKTAAKSTARR